MVIGGSDNHGLSFCEPTQKMAPPSWGPSRPHLGHIHEHPQHLGEILKESHATHSETDQSDIPTDRKSEFTTAIRSNANHR